MRIKICGITKAGKGIPIPNLGATALGFIWVSNSPYYIQLSQIKAIVQQLLPERLTPNNLTQTLSLVKPDGIDLSSGVEESPGHKDLVTVAQLLTKLGLTA